MDRDGIFGSEATGVRPPQTRLVKYFDQDYRGRFCRFPVTVQRYPLRSLAVTVIVERPSGLGNASAGLGLPYKISILI